MFAYYKVSGGGWLTFTNNVEIYPVLSVLNYITPGLIDRIRLSATNASRVRWIFETIRTTIQTSRTAVDAAEPQVIGTSRDNSYEAFAIPGHLLGPNGVPTVAIVLPNAAPGGAPDNLLDVITTADYLLNREHLQLLCNALKYAYISLEDDALDIWRDLVCAIHIGANYRVRDVSPWYRKYNQMCTPLLTDVGLFPELLRILKVLVASGVATRGAIDFLNPATTGLIKPPKSFYNKEVALLQAVSNSCNITPSLVAKVLNRKIGEQQDGDNNIYEAMWELRTVA